MENMGKNPIGCIDANDNGSKNITSKSVKWYQEFHKAHSP